MTENAYRNSSSTVLTQILQYNHQCGALLPINVKNLQNVIALKVMTAILTCSALFI